MKNFNRKKTTAIISLFAVLTVLLTVMCTVTSFAAGAKYTQKEVGINISVGYSSGKLIPDKIVPVYVTVANNTKDDIKGTLYLTLGNSDAVSEYSRDFVLPAGVEKTVDFSVFFCQGYYYQNNVGCRIETSGGRLLAEKKEPYIEVINSESKMVGWMTEDSSEPNPAKILENVVLSNTGGRFLVEKLTPDYFPSNEAMIDEFDIIFVNNVDFSGSSSYTAEQLALLDHYISEGGIVFLGTGSKKDSNLTGFAKYFNGRTSDACEMITKGDVSDYFIGSYFDNYYSGMSFEMKEIPLCEITDVNFEKLGNDDASVIYSHKKYNIFVTEFAIDDGIFTNETDGFIYLISKICSADLDSYGRIMEPYSYQQGYDDFLKYDDQNRMPRAWVILLIMTAYIVLAIILPFIILKKKNKSQYFWITVPAAALLFSGIIFLYGQILHGKSMSNTLKLVKINETGANKAIVRTEWYSSKSGKANLSIGEEEYIFADNYLFTNPSSYLYETSDKYYNYGSETYQKFNAVKGSFVTADAVCTDKTYRPLKAKATFDSSNNKVSVEVENTSGRNLSDVFAIAYGTTVIIGDLKAGEKITVSESALQYQNMNYIVVEDQKLIAEFCYRKLGLNTNLVSAESANQWGIFYMDNTSDYYKSLKKDPDIYRRAWIIANLSFIMNGKKYDDAYIFAFDDADEVSVTVNGKEASKKYSNTLIYQEIGSETEYVGPVEDYSDKAEMIKNVDDGLYDGFQMKTLPNAIRGMSMSSQLNEYIDFFYCLRVPSDAGSAYYKKMRIIFPEETDFIPDVKIYDVISDRFDEIELDSGETAFNSHLYLLKNTENMSDYNIKGEYRKAMLQNDFLSLEFYDDKGTYHYLRHPDSYNGYFEGYDCIIFALGYDPDEVKKHISINGEQGVFVPDSFDVILGQ